MAPIFRHVGVNVSDHPTMTLRYPEGDLQIGPMAGDVFEKYRKAILIFTMMKGKTGPSRYMEGGD